MRWLGLTLSTLALLSIPGCNDSPTAPDEAAAFDKAVAGHSAGRMVAGGQLREGEWKISFSGHANISTDGERSGRWQTQFHSVSIPEFVGKKFVSTEIVGFGFVPSDNPAECTARSNLYMAGTLDGEPGYFVRVLATDAGKIGGGAFDTFRIVLYDADATALYDTSDNNPERPGGDFPSVSNCAGASRAELDKGNVKFWLPD